MQDFSGQHINRYRLTDRLGVGGMAVVYKAYDTRLERYVALKLIRRDEIPASQHEDLLKRFEREAKSQARFDHKHIVTIYDFGVVDGVPYLVMSYLPVNRSITGRPSPGCFRLPMRWLMHTTVGSSIATSSPATFSLMKTTSQC